MGACGYAAYHGIIVKEYPRCSEVAREADDENADWMPRLNYNGRIASVYDDGRALPLEALEAWRAALAR